MNSRPLHAVLLPATAGERIVAALAAALDGSGPAILPLDSSLPQPAMEAALRAFAPSAIETTEGTRPCPFPADRTPDPVGDDIAVVIATSGSTGVPKGVQLTAAALTASAAASMRRIGAAPADRWLCCLPTFHISGVGVLVRSLIAGTNPVITPSLNAEILTSSNCKLVSLVPTQLRRLVDAGCPPGPVEAVLLGGAATPGDLLTDARAAGWRIVTTYGMTETCGGCVYDGLPLDGVSVDTDSDGRIRIAGPVLFSGYRLQPELTTSVMDDGWFRTADLGQVGPDGHVVVRGRADDVIISGGEKIVPGEVEAVLGTGGGVADVVVIGVPDPEWGEAVTAFVVPADAAAPPDAERLRANVREAVSAHAAPKRILVVPEFPLLPSGKPDRAALRRLAGAAGC
jgi:o-succinylbenzoate---CoA ligase